MPELQEIEIEEYVPAKHAASIAEMWNRSAESWGETERTGQRKVCCGNTRTAPCSSCSWR